MHLVEYICIALSRTLATLDQQDIYSGNRWENTPKITRVSVSRDHEIVCVLWFMLSVIHTSWIDFFCGKTIIPNWLPRAGGQMNTLNLSQAKIGYQRKNNFKAQMFQFFYAFSFL